MSISTDDAIDVFVGLAADAGGAVLVDLLGTVAQLRGSGAGAGRQEELD